MIQLIKLLRVHHWIKNTFIFLPIFFAGQIFNFEKLIFSIYGFFAFGLIASGVYILNDIQDLASDRNHPVKSQRPLASGKISKRTAFVVLLILVLVGFSIAYILSAKFFYVLVLYFILNLFYSFGLKNFSIVDVIVVSIGFNLRVKAGGYLADVHVSIWLNVLIFLLALFMALAKRRDDIILQLESGLEIRKSIKGYNLDFLTSAITMICAVSFVAYLMYTISPFTIERLGTYKIYYTSLFVLAGILRYMQIVYVYQESGSPTKILYRDRFIQLSIILWSLAFIFILYFK